MNAQLYIQTARRGNVTYLKKSFCTPPFKIADITEDIKKNTLQLMLMSSSPGILDGDEINLKIEVEENTSLQLHTQSYQRLYNMKTGASQQMTIHLEKNASFCFLPHPTVPHKNSYFTATNKIYLSDNCHLIFGEILTCGRKLSGEVFLFSKYHNITEIYLNNKLVIKENILIQPSVIDINTIGQLEGYTHQATLIFINNVNVYSLKTINDFITDYLSPQNNIEFGVSALQVKGILIRIIGQKAEQLFDCLKNITNYLQQYSSPKLNLDAI